MYSNCIWSLMTKVRLLTLDNVDGRAPLRSKHFTERLFGKLFSNRGFVGQDLFEQFFVDGLHLVFTFSFF